MELVSIQIALFLKETLRRPDLYYNEINKEMGGIFDAIPTIIPLPDNAPLEIPVVQMFSIDGKYKLNIARGRIDFFCLSQTLTNSFKAITMQEVHGLVERFYKSILRSKQLYRVGYVFTAFHEDNDAVRTIARKYFSGEEFYRCSELSLYRNLPITIEKKKINCLLKVSSGNVTKGQTDYPGIIIEQDINTPLTETEKIDESVIVEVIKLATRYMDEHELERLL